jgi:uncharacterized membrane protein YphA (DoxX/SURF4 family)
MQNDVTIERDASVASANGRDVRSRLETLAATPLMKTLSLGARLLLGIILLTAGAEKLTALDQFAHSIANYKILPIAMINIAALAFVWIEIVSGVLLIAGALVRGTALVSSALMLIFIVAVASAMARGLQIDCGCFVATAGGTPEKVGWPKLMEDAGLLAAGIFLIYFPKSYFTIGRLLGRADR